MSEPVVPDPSVRRPRKPRSDGERSRRAILDEAARLATLDGIGGLSIARLADAVGMSKSGLFAHFGSKEELQLATVEAACEVFTENVTQPGTLAGTAIGRLRALTDGYLRYVADDTFPGGCFFASVLAEMDTHPGAVRDRLVQFLGEWLDVLRRTIVEAQAEGTIDPKQDPDQLVFEIESALYFANAQYVAARTPEPIERATRAIEARLASAAPPKSARKASAGR